MRMLHSALLRVTLLPRTVWVGRPGRLRRGLLISCWPALGKPQEGARNRPPSRHLRRPAVRVARYAEDRGVPWHWEGDMASGSGSRDARGAAQIIKLENKTTDCVIAALTAKVQELPEQLKQSLSRDRGLGMARQRQFTVDTRRPSLLLRPQGSGWQAQSRQSLLARSSPSPPNCARSRPRTM